MRLGFALRDSFRLGVPIELLHALGLRERVFGFHEQPAMPDAIELARYVVDFYWR